MYKFAFVVLAIVASTFAAPNPKPGVVVGYTAPVVAPAVVTAQSSQVFHRNYNGLVAPLVAAAPIVKAAAVVEAPLVRSAPVVAAAPALASYYNPYIASPYVAAPFSYL